jgi:hypothetical protein
MVGIADAFSTISLLMGVPPSLTCANVPEILMRHNKSVQIICFFICVGWFNKFREIKFRIFFPESTIIEEEDLPKTL